MPAWLRAQHCQDLLQTKGKELLPKAVAGLSSPSPYAVHTLHHTRGLTRDSLLSLSQ